MKYISIFQQRREEKIWNYSSSLLQSITLEKGDNELVSASGNVKTTYSEKLHCNITIIIYFLCQLNASQHVWHPHMIMSKVPARGKEHRGRIEILLSSARIWFLWFSLAELVNYLSGLLQCCLGKLCLWFICSYVSSGYLPVAAVEKQFQRHFVSLSHWFSADQVTALHNATNLRYASAASEREQSVGGELLIVWDCCWFLRHVVLHQWLVVLNILDWGSAAVLLEYEPRVSSKTH